MAPTLNTIKSSVNFGYLNFGLVVYQSYKRFNLQMYGARFAVFFKLEITCQTLPTSNRHDCWSKISTQITWLTIANLANISQQRPDSTHYSQFPDHFCSLNIKWAATEWSEDIHVIYATNKSFLHT